MLTRTTLNRIGLVGCVKEKRATGSPARDLYVSDLFTKARKYTEVHYDRWFVLSAKYHLISPEALVEPYDETLNDKTTDERKTWAEETASQIRKKLPDPKTAELYFHAGIRYREFLIPLLAEVGYSCKVPLEGLKIGEQLAWYKKHTS